MSLQERNIEDLQKKTLAASIFIVQLKVCTPHFRFQKVVVCKILMKNSTEAVVSRYSVKKVLLKIFKIHKKTLLSKTIGSDGFLGTLL